MVYIHLNQYFVKKSFKISIKIPKLYAKPLKIFKRNQKYEDFQSIQKKFLYLKGYSLVLTYFVMYNIYNIIFRTIRNVKNFKDVAML